MSFISFKGNQEILKTKKWLMKADQVLDSMLTKFQPERVEKTSESYPILSRSCHSLNEPLEYPTQPPRRRAVSTNSRDEKRHCIYQYESLIKPIDHKRSISCPISNSTESTHDIDSNDEINDISSKSKGLSKGDDDNLKYIKRRIRQVTDFDEMLENGFPDQGFTKTSKIEYTLRISLTPQVASN